MAGGTAFRTARHAALRNALRLRAWLGFTATPPPAVLELPPDLVEPVIEPRFGIDGWTYRGTVLEERFPGHIEAELAPLAHAICAGMATPWTYERTARLLEAEGAHAQAYAVLASGIASGLPVDAALSRWRGRLAAAVLRQPSDQ